MMQEPRRTFAIPLWRIPPAVVFVMLTTSLSAMVFIRKDLGYRLLRPLYLFSACGIMCLFGCTAFLYLPEARPEGLFLFAALMLLGGFEQRTKRWREFKRGQLQHSYYIGTSIFSFRWLPAYFHRYRRIGRVIDPLIWGMCGYCAIPYNPAIGLWIIFSAMCLLNLEGKVFKRELNETFDVQDGLVNSEVQTERVETFERPPKKEPKRWWKKKKESSGIPTGIGPDIAKQIKRRRR